MTAKTETAAHTDARPWTRSRAEAAGIAAAVLLGLALVWVAGFAQAAAVHDLAHDQRHAIAFPCH